MPIKAYKYRLYPNKEQEQKLLWTLDRCRELYNAALQERKEAYKYAGKSISFSQQSAQLPEIKEIREEYQDIYGQVLQNVLRRVQKAIDDFFRRIKSGDTPGYPRFQGKNRYDSFTYPQMSYREHGGFSLKQKHVYLPKIGNIKVKLHRKLQGKPKTCTIKREGEQWYVYFACEIPDAEKLPVSYEDVGVDLGITHFAALSNGEFIDNPRYYRKAEKKLKKVHQGLDRKKKGSHRREKAKKHLSRCYTKVKNQRRDFLHKESRKLANRYQIIVFEDLQTENLVKRPKPKQDEETGQYLPNGASAKAGLNKSIRDAGWSMFVQMTHVKAEWAGRVVLKVNPYKTSQICSGCLKEGSHKDLSERTHTCVHCGLVLDRDTNAAINILEAGRASQSAMAVRAAQAVLHEKVYKDGTEFEHRYKAIDIYTEDRIEKKPVLLPCWGVSLPVGCGTVEEEDKAIQERKA